MLADEAQASSITIGSTTERKRNVIFAYSCLFPGFPPSKRGENGRFLGRLFLFGAPAHVGRLPLVGALAHAWGRARSTERGGFQLKKKENTTSISQMSSFVVGIGHGGYGPGRVKSNCTDF